MMKREMIVRALAVFICLVVSACGASQRSEQALNELPPPALLPAEALEDDIFLRQSVHAEWSSGETRFDAIVQKEGARLQLVGLSPAGQIGFIFTLESGEISVENRAGRTLPFSPAWILADVQRAFYPAAAFDGSELRAVERAGDNGLPLRREFYRGSERVVLIDYGAYEGRKIAPSSLRLENLEYGYTLTIETLEEAELNQPEE